MTWDLNLPSGSSALSLGAAQFRSDFSTIQDAMDREHFFSPSSNTTMGGFHRMGAGRAFADSRSSLSVPGVEPAGRIFLAASPIQSLHMIGTSSHTTLSSGVSGTGFFDGLGGGSGGSTVFGSPVASYLTFVSPTYQEGGTFISGTTQIINLQGAGVYLVGARVEANWSSSAAPTSDNTVELGVEHNGVVVALSSTSFANATPAGSITVESVVTAAPGSTSYVRFPVSASSFSTDGNLTHAWAVKLA